MKEISVVFTGSPYIISGTVERKLIDGGIVHLGCSRRSHSLPVLGPYGWPCEYGAAVILQKANVHGYSINSVVLYFYLVRMHSEPRYTPERVMNRFRGLVLRAAMKEPRLQDASVKDAVNLTRLAENFDFYRMNDKADGLLNGCIFKAVAFIPVFGKQFEDVMKMQGYLEAKHVLSSAMGVSADFGGFVIDSYEVPMPRVLDLNLPPAPTFLYAVATSPPGGCT